MSDEVPSKTQRKKDMHELQDLGAERVALTDQQLASIELPERLRDAVQEARRMTKFEAKRRQMQYIGKVMRDIDPEPIRERLAGWKSVSYAQTARLHAIERWRTRLLEEDSALTDFLHEHPSADSGRLQQLVQGVHAERQAGRPPRSYRALFKLLNEIMA